MYDLSFAAGREKLAAAISAQVEADSVAEYDEPEGRRHLGGSIIGHECQWYLWGQFRWLKKEALSGRMHRLFKRGHFEEPKFIHRLRRIGFEVFEFDADGKQYKIEGCDGHYGGSLDGVAIAPAELGLPGPLLAEFKTHGEKWFAELAGPITKKMPDIVRDKSKAQGMRKSQPQHFAQMCTYGQAYNLPYGLYCAINKNTDELYFEIVALDFDFGIQLYEKARRIIGSQTQPPKLSQSASFYKCKMCSLSAQCHYGSPPDLNCRSCEHASPEANGEWYCRVFEGNIQRENIPKGCPQYRRIV